MNLNVKTLLIFSALLLAAAATFGIYQFRRTNERVGDLDADFRITAVDLIREFRKDVNRSNAKFVSKVISVSGTVSKIDNSAKPFVIFLQQTNVMSTVKCGMDVEFANADGAIQTGDLVVIKGICVGGENLDFDLGTDVTLKRCVIEKVNN